MLITDKHVIIYQQNDSSIRRLSLHQMILLKISVNLANPSFYQSGEMEFGLNSE